MTRVICRDIAPRARNLRGVSVASRGLMGRMSERNDELQRRVQAMIARHLGVLNRLDSHLGCAKCRRPLTDGRCPVCQPLCPGSGDHVLYYSPEWYTVDCVRCGRRLDVPVKASSPASRRMFDFIPDHEPPEQDTVE